MPTFQVVDVWKDDQLEINTVIMLSQLAVTCSKLTKKFWNMFTVNNKETRTRQMTSFRCLYCYLWTHFVPYSSIASSPAGLQDCILITYPQVKTIWHFSSKETEKPAKISNARVPNRTPTTDVFPDLTHTSKVKKSFVIIFNGLKMD